MKQVKVTLLIDVPEEVEDVHPELIAADFFERPELFFFKWTVDLDAERATVKD